MSICLYQPGRQVEPCRTVMPLLPPPLTLFPFIPCTSSLSPRATPTARTPDWRFPLERGRTSRTPIGSRRIHTRYSFATPFVDPSRGRNPACTLLFPAYSLSSTSSSSTPLVSDRCDSPLSHGAPSQCISPPALFHLSRRIFLNKYFFNKRRAARTA